jgi:hypothetical protein
MAFFCLRSNHRIDFQKDCSYEDLHVHMTKKCFYMGHDEDNHIVLEEEDDSDLYPFHAAILIKGLRTFISPQPIFSPHDNMEIGDNDENNAKLHKKIYNVNTSNNYNILRYTAVYVNDTRVNLKFNGRNGICHPLRNNDIVQFGDTTHYRFVYRDNAYTSIQNAAKDSDSLLFRRLVMAQEYDLV